MNISTQNDEQGDLDRLPFGLFIVSKVYEQNGVLPDQAHQYDHFARRIWRMSHED